MINKLLKHGTLFIFSKSIVLIAPLFAAYLLNKSAYGTFEWSLSIAMIISTMITVGAGNTIAFEKVKNEESPLISIGQRYSFYLGILFALLSITLLTFFNEVRIGLVLGMSSFLVIQYALSAYMKANGLGARASVVDSGIYTILLVLLGLAWLNGDSDLSYLVIYAIVAIILGIFLHNTINTSSVLNKEEIMKFVKRGFPIMLSGGMVILFFNLPKLFLGYESMMYVGEFSLYLRWASLALVVYQFIVVVFFRDIYTNSYIEFDKFIASISFGVYLLGFTILIFLYLAKKYNIEYLPVPEVNLSVQILMVSIIALWALTASLEGLIYREDKSIHQMWANIVGIIIFFLLSFLTGEHDDIIYFITFSWFISFVAIILYQLFIIHKDILEMRFVFINFLFILIFGVTFFILEVMK